jgi:hypothetical protein
MLIDLKVFLNLGMTLEEKSQLIELTDLQIGLRYLKSQYLEKRIRGLQDIRYMIDRVWVTKHLSQVKQRNNLKYYNQNYNILFDDELDITRLPNTYYLTPELMLQWLK